MIYLVNPNVRLNSRMTSERFEKSQLAWLMDSRTPSEWKASRKQSKQKIELERKLLWRN